MLGPPLDFEARRQGYNILVARANDIYGLSHENGLVTSVEEN